MKTHRIMFTSALMVALLACNAQTAKVVAKSAIDVGLASCIADHADIVDEPALREVCKWTDELAPTVKELLSARKSGLAKVAKAGACAPAPAGSAK